MRLRSSLAIIGVLLSVFAPMGMTIVFAEDAPKVPLKKEGGVNLLQPIGDLTEVSTFEEYVETFIFFAVDAGVGIVAVWVVVSGIMYMTAGSDQGATSAAKEHITWALIGLFVLLFMNFILKTLNNVYFT